MSLSELELFEHATHLSGERPDGMRYGGGGRESGKGERHKFHLEASIFSQQVLASHGEGQVRATSLCGVVSVLNISKSAET